MTDFNIVEIFNSIVDYGCTIRKFVLLTKPKENIGLNAWRMIKESFNDLNLKQNQEKYYQR